MKFILVESRPVELQLSGSPEITAARAILRWRAEAVYSQYGAQIDPGLPVDSLTDEQAAARLERDTCNAVARVINNRGVTSLRARGAIPLLYKIFMQDILDYVGPTTTVPNTMRSPKVEEKSRGDFLGHAILTAARCVSPTTGMVGPPVNEPCWPPKS